MGREHVVHSRSNEIDVIGFEGVFAKEMFETLAEATEAHRPVVSVELRLEGSCRLLNKDEVRFQLHEKGHPFYEHPEIVGFLMAVHDPRVVSVMSKVIPLLPNLINTTFSEDLEQRIRDLVKILVPAQGASDGRRRTEIANAELRARFLSEWPTLSAVEIAEVAGSLGKNRYQTANRWERDGKIFSVPAGDSARYPEFQFVDGRPLPVVAQVLKVMKEKRSPWQIAFWFVTENGWLDDDARPVDFLTSAPEAVVEAASHDVQDLVP